jgi:hypothetical protein
MATITEKIKEYFIALDFFLQVKQQEGRSQEQMSKDRVWISIGGI